MRPATPQNRSQYHRLRRIIAMVREGMAGGRLPNRSDFRRELEVSPRTLARDLDFLRNEEREAIAAVARRAECPFAAFWLEAPQATLRDRVEERRRDASDADAEVVDLQARQDPGNLAWPRLDTRQGPQAVAEDARKAL